MPLLDAGGSTDGSPPLIDSATAPQDSAPEDTSTALPDALADMGTGDTTPVFGALQFDGINDVVELPTAAGAGANETAFSVEVWFNTTAPTGCMFEVYSTGGADRFIFLDGGKVCFYVYGTPVTKLCSPTAGYNDGMWHHAAGTMGVQGGMRVYADGSLVASSPKPGSSNFKTDSNFRLGYGHTAFLSALVYYKGKLDEVRVWSVERTGADILAAYRSRLPPTTAGLQGYWPLDETGVATTTKDLTTPANDGMLKNFTFTTSPWTGPGAL